MGEKGKPRESQWWTQASKAFTGLKCAAANLQGKEEKKGGPDNLRNIPRVQVRENNKLVVFEKAFSLLTGTLSSCVTKAGVIQKSAILKSCLWYGTVGHVALLVSPFL